MALADRRRHRFLRFLCAVVCLVVAFGCASSGPVNTTLEYDHRYGDWGLTVDKCVYDGESFTFTLMGIVGGSAQDRDSWWYDKDYYGE